MTLALGLSALTGAMLLTSPGRAATEIEVTTASGLADALSAATPGTVIVLAAGDYGGLRLKNWGGEAGAPIVLRARDKAALVRFGALDLRGIRHLVLDGLTFDYTFKAGDKLHARPFNISGSQDITVSNSLFDGDVTPGTGPKDGFPTGLGLLLRGNHGITLTQSEIRSFHRGIAVTECADLVIQNNDIHDIRSDGMDFSQVQRVRIEGNHIHDFKRLLDSPDHADMIQFWTNGTTEPSTDITIRDNILNSGMGWYTQSIFMRNDLVDTGKAGAEMFYRNITIENNVIVNAHTHGISVGATAGLVIANNALIRNQASQGIENNTNLWTPKMHISVLSTNVVIKKNVVADMTGPDNQADWVVADNFLIQDRFPDQPGFYEAVFTAPYTGDPGDLASFAYKAGGALDGSGLGAPQLDRASAFFSQGKGVHPVIRVIPDPRYANQVTLDAGSSLVPKGVAADQIRYDWALDDGANFAGITLNHIFARTGPHRISLTVTLPDGTSAISQSTVTVPDPDVLTFSARTGTFTSHVRADPQTVTKLDLPPGPVVLGQGTPTIMINPDLISTFFRARDFELRLRLRGAGTFKSAGEVLRIHQSLVVTISGRGTLIVQAATAEAKLTLTTRAVPHIFDQWHDFSLVYSAAAGLFTVTADGVVIGQGKLTGPTRLQEFWGLTVGSPFGKTKSFDGEMESLTLRVNQERAG